MKGRPKNIRKISFMPTVSGFRPYGGQHAAAESEGVFLHYEEYESIRLNDYEKHTHCESAAIMGVSRPTFTRIYKGAREKIAKAFIEGRNIIIEGGKVELDGNWYVCAKCHAMFPSEGQAAQYCALCGSEEISRYALPDSETPDTGSAPFTETAPHTAVTIEGLKMSTPDSGKKRGCQRRGCHQATAHNKNR